MNVNDISEKSLLVSLTSSSEIIPQYRKREDITPNSNYDIRIYIQRGLKLMLRFSIIFVYYGIGMIFYAINERWTFTDCAYFITVTLSTVGFGELVPSNTSSRLFTVFYALIGIFLLLGEANNLGLYLIKNYQNKYIDRLGLSGSKKSGLKITISFIWLFLLIGIATGSYYYLEDFDVVTSFYFTMITMLTIGYGDIITLNNRTKNFSIVFIILMIVCFATLLNNIYTAFMEFRHYKLRQFFLKNFLSKEYSVTQIVERLVNSRYNSISQNTLSTDTPLSLDSSNSDYHIGGNANTVGKKNMATVGNANTVGRSKRIDSTIAIRKAISQKKNYSTRVFEFFENYFFFSNFTESEKAQMPLQNPWERNGQKSPIVISEDNGSIIVDRHHEPIGRSLPHSPISKVTNLDSSMDCLTSSLPSPVASVNSDFDNSSFSSSVTRSRSNSNLHQQFRKYSSQRIHKAHTNQTEYWRNLNEEQFVVEMLIKLKRINFRRDVEPLIQLYRDIHLIHDEIDEQQGV